MSDFVKDIHTFLASRGEMIYDNRGQCTVCALAQLDQIKLPRGVSTPLHQMAPYSALRTIDWVYRQRVIGNAADKLPQPDMRLARAIFDGLQEINAVVKAHQQRLNVILKQVRARGCLSHARLRQLKITWESFARECLAAEGAIVAAASEAIVKARMVVLLERCETSCGSAYWFKLESEWYGADDVVA